MKKTLWLIAGCASLSLMLTGCAGNSEPMPDVAATTQPSASASPAATALNPMATRMPADPTLDVTDMTGQPDAVVSPEAAGATTVSDIRKAVEQIEDDLERLSEVEDAQVLISGNTAAVALEFDPRYQGGVDDRLRKMVRERIDGVLSGVTDVSITTDPDVMDQLETLGDRLEDGIDLSDLTGELNDIIKKIKAALS